MTRAELASRYEVSTRTLLSWLKKHPAIFGGITGQRILCPSQVRAIFEAIGEPPEKAVNKHN